MQLTITSISGNALSTEQFESLTVSTQDGVITLLPGHEPLIAALHPGILEVQYEGKRKHFALGGWVVETDGKSIRILADMVEDGGHDLAAIQERKHMAEAQMLEYRQNGGTSLSLEAYIELEQEYLKDAAREQLAQK